MKIEIFIVLLIGACYAHAETFSEAVFKKENFDLTKRDPEELFALQNFIYYVFLGQNITNPGPDPLEILDQYDFGLDLAFYYAFNYAVNYLVDNGYDLLDLPIDLFELDAAIGTLQCTNQSFTYFQQSGNITCGSSAVSIKSLVPLLSNIRFLSSTFCRIENKNGIFIYFKNFLLIPLKLYSFLSKMEMVKFL
jgi:hypothetical protein